MLNKNLKIKLISAYFFIAAILIFDFFVFLPEIKEALALNQANYNKSAGDTLTVQDWNRLDDDFLAINPALGNLNMDGHIISNLGSPTANGDAVNMQYVDDEIDAAIASMPPGSINDESGDPIRMFCGETLPAEWVITGSHDLYVNVVTSAAGFSSTPYYLTSLLGDSQHWRTTGATSIVNPTATGFTVQLHYNEPTNIGTVPYDRNWRIVWCGVGN